MKNILCVIGSKSIIDVDFSRYLCPQDFSEVVCGGANCVDTLAEAWAKENDLEFSAFLPNYYAYGQEKAPAQRDREMLEFSDCLVAFWDGQSQDVLAAVCYAIQLGIPYRLHEIEDY